MLRISVLSSGSKANCTFIESDNARILIDCGLSGRETSKRLASIGVDADTIDAIVVTHEHSDHVRGVRVFSKRHSTKVFANERTFASVSDFTSVPDSSKQIFATGEKFSIEDITIEPFSIAHDAADPVAFVLENKSSRVCSLTDLGQVTTLVRTKVKDLDALVLESNHEPELLHEAPYPWGVKQRISSRMGHLSNQDAGSFVSEFSKKDGGRLRYLIAGHISENSNMPAMALESLQRSWVGEGEPPKIEAASVYRNTALYEV